MTEWEFAPAPLWSRWEGRWGWLCRSHISERRKPTKSSKWWNQPHFLLWPPLKPQHRVATLRTILRRHWRISSVLTSQNFSAKVIISGTAPRSVKEQIPSDTVSSGWERAFRVGPSWVPQSSVLESLQFLLSLAWPRRHLFHEETESQRN